MKRVFYINCFADPWVKVAQKLQQLHDYQPVYWLGYNDDNSDKLVTETLPQTTYHPTFDAWRDIFPDEVQQAAQQATIDIDFLRQYASQELQGIKMMDRLDLERHSFNFMERQRHWRNLIRHWTAAIDLLRPDLVVTPMLPHRVYDYALYCLCQYRNIPFLVFNHTQFNGRFMILDDIYSIGHLFEADYEQLKAQTQQQLYELLPEDIKERFDKVKGDYTGAAPYYMATEAKQQKKNTSLLSIISNQCSSLWDARKTILHDVGHWVTMYYKYSPDKSLQEKTSVNLLEHYAIKWRNNRYLKRLKQHYESLTVKPDYGEPYVIYFLHYQPEATTSPTGDIFVDQALCIDMLLKNTPPQWKVYVKEHPHQFLFHREGATSRIREFYHDLLRNPRVRLISTEENTFDLIEHCQAIGTVCGTVGWETIVRGKPVVLFGLSWYENFAPSVLRVTDEASARGMTDFVSGHHYDEHALLAYLAAVGRNTRRAYYYKAMFKKQLGLTEQQCVDNIVDAIIEEYNS